MPDWHYGWWLSRSASEGDFLSIGADGALPKAQSPNIELSNHLGGRMSVECLIGGASNFG